MHGSLPAAVSHRTDRRCIVLFLFDLEPSGVVVNTIRLANALAAGGHDVRLLVCRDESRSREELHARVRVMVLPGGDRRSASRGLALIQAIPSLRATLRALRPDILVSAGNHGHAAALLAAWGLPGMSRVLRISNEPDHPGDGPVLRLVRGLLLRCVARLADRLLLVSPRLARHRAFADAVRSGQAKVVPNGVAVDEVRRLADEPCAHPWLDTAEPLVVTVGRIVRQKNLPTLIRAVARAGRTRPMRLLIVGKGEPAAQARLRALAAELNIADRVDFAGEQANPFPFVGAASVFVLPSLWEGRSNVLLEAMACGVPIVASRTAGDAPELLGYGCFGALVDPLDEEAMAAAIVRQTGAAPCLPGTRAAEFGQDAAVALACEAILEARVDPAQVDDRDEALTGRIAVAA